MKKLSDYFKNKLKFADENTDIPKYNSESDVQLELSKVQDNEYEIASRDYIKTPIVFQTTVSESLLESFNICKL